MQCSNPRDGAHGDDRVAHGDCLLMGLRRCGAGPGQQSAISAEHRHNIAEHRHNIAEHRRTSPNITEDRPGRRCMKSDLRVGEYQ